MPLGPFIRYWEGGGIKPASRGWLSQDVGNKGGPRRAGLGPPETVSHARGPGLVLLFVRNCPGPGGLALGLLSRGSGCRQQRAGWAWAGGALLTDPPPCWQALVAALSLSASQSRDRSESGASVGTVTGQCGQTGQVMLGPRGVMARPPLYHLPPSGLMAV